MKTGKFRRGNWRYVLKVLRTHPLTRNTSGDSEFFIIYAVAVFECRECWQKTSPFEAVLGSDKGLFLGI